MCDEQNETEQGEPTFEVEFWDGMFDGVTDEEMRRFDASCHYNFVMAQTRNGGAVKITRCEEHEGWLARAESIEADCPDPCPNCTYTYSPER